jgi:hypothetical protein
MEPEPVEGVSASAAAPAGPSLQEEGAPSHDSHSFGGQVSPVRAHGARDGRRGELRVQQSGQPAASSGSAPPAPTPPRPPPPDPQRARSQVSTAVSFEGARPAGSAALPSRSVDEESALSAAEADGARRGAAAGAMRARDAP